MDNVALVLLLIFRYSTFNFLKGTIRARGNEVSRYRQYLLITNKLGVLIIRAKPYVRRLDSTRMLSYNILRCSYRYASLLYWSRHEHRHCQS